MNSKKELIDDNSEFIDNAVHDENLDETPPPEAYKNLYRKVKDKLPKEAALSQLSKKQVYLFMSWAELDLLRHKDEQLGIIKLYKVYCARGTKYWLDPSPWLRQLDRILELYTGKGPQRKEVLSPFVELLIDCGTHDINPTSFLQYIMEPRLSRDKDWRQWPKRHLAPLKIILHILKELRKSPPFDRPVLGSEGNRLTRDVVLVKYGGKPLSFYSENDLAREDMEKKYISAWRNLSLDNAFTIFFMKSNVLHFMYTFSGKISFQHLIAILQQMPQIEEGFRENFPSETFNINVSAIPLNLYDYDINKSILKRREKGFKNTDFTRELHAYMDIISSLLKTSAGIYLCGYFARKLTAFKNPDLADSMSRLIDVLTDNGGKHIYIWHTSKLLTMNVSEHDFYLNMISEAGGCDPLYPAAGDIFHEDLSEFLKPEDLISSLEELDITMEDIACSSQRSENSLNASLITPGMILNAYMDKFSNRAEFIEEIIDDVCNGEDGKWDDKKIHKIDSLGGPLHYPLLKRMIKGINAAFFFQSKSRSFSELFHLYDHNQGKYFHKGRVDFSLAVGDAEDFLSLDNRIQHQVRKQVDITRFQDLWTCLMSEEKNINSILPSINQMAMSYIKPVEKIESELIKLSRNDGIDKKTAKKIKKKEKSLNVMKGQRKNLLNIMSLFENSGDNEKLLILLLIGGAKSQTGDDFSRNGIGCCVNMFMNKASVSERIAFLKQDVPIEILTLDQAKWIMNTLDVLLNELTAEVDKILKKNEFRQNELLEIFRPYILTRSGDLNNEAFDAAFKSMTSYNKLTSLISKWQEILEKNHVSEKKRAHFTIMTSAEPLDAYYGDMGSICLSGYPELSKHESFINCRLISHKDRSIVGMAVLYYSSYSPDKNYSKGFWHAFAINPLPSLLGNLTFKNQMTVYLHFRSLFEKVSRESGKPVTLSGISTWGIVSNSDNFARGIIALERKWGAVETMNARGLNVHYKENEFSHGLIIIDPERKESYKT